MIQSIIDILAVNETNLIRFNFSKELVLYDPDPRPSFEWWGGGGGGLLFKFAKT